jgi:hypothetical protein
MEQDGFMSGGGSGSDGLDVVQNDRFGYKEAGSGTGTGTGTGVVQTTPNKKKKKKKRGRPRNQNPEPVDDDENENENDDDDDDDDDDENQSPQQSSRITSPKKRKRGRPPKHQSVGMELEEGDADIEIDENVEHQAEDVVDVKEEEEEEPLTAKLRAKGQIIGSSVSPKKRGRPSKHQQNQYEEERENIEFRESKMNRDASLSSSSSSSSPPPKKRGRPKKNDTNEESTLPVVASRNHNNNNSGSSSSSSINVPSPPKKRGRPRKVVVEKEGTHDTQKPSSSDSDFSIVLNYDHFKKRDGPVNANANVLPTSKSVSASASGSADTHFFDLDDGNEGQELEIVYSETNNHDDDDEDLMMMMGDEEAENEIMETEQEYSEGGARGLSNCGGGHGDHAEETGSGDEGVDDMLHDFFLDVSFLDDMEREKEVESTQQGKDGLVRSRMITNPNKAGTGK